MCGPGGVRQLISEEGLVSNNTIRSDTILRIELCSLQCAEGTIDKFGMRLIGLLPNSADPWPRRRASPVCEMWDVCGSSSKSVLAFFDLLLWLDLNFALVWYQWIVCPMVVYHCIESPVDFSPKEINHSIVPKFTIVQVYLRHTGFMSNSLSSLWNAPSHYADIQYSYMYGVKDNILPIFHLIKQLLNSVLYLRKARIG